MSDIKALKMVSGEEVICKVTETEDGETLIESPLVLQVMRAPDGGFGLGLIPWIHSVKSGQIRLNPDQIMAVVEPDKEVIDGYLSQTSGIQLASAGSILHG